MPATVDSCAVAGMVDLLRTKGCFGLSARYVICLGLKTSKMHADSTTFPPYSLFEKIGTVFEEVLGEMLKATTKKKKRRTRKVKKLKRRKKMKKKKTRMRTKKKLTMQMMRMKRMTTNK